MIPPDVPTMHTSRFLLAAWMIAAAFAVLPEPGEAQIGGRLRDAAARAAEREATRQIERRVENTVRCVFDDLECLRKAEREGKTVEVIDSQGNPAPTRDAPAGTASPATPPASAGADDPDRAARRAEPLRFSEIRSATASFNTCGLTAAGELYCWGNSALVSGSSEPRRVPGTEHLRLRTFELSPGGGIGCGLTQEGAAYCWGESYRLFLRLLPEHLGGSPPGIEAMQSAIPLQGGHRFERIALGVSHACGLTSEGAAFCWNFSSSDTPQSRPITLGDGKGSSAYEVTFSVAPVRVASNERFVQIAAGLHQTCALTASGSARCWGSQSGAREWNSPRPFAPAIRFSSLFNAFAATCGITTDGQVLCWEQRTATETCWSKWEGIDIRCSSTPAPVSVPRGFRLAAGSMDQTCGVSSDGATYCWGYYVGQHLVTPPADRCFYKIDSKVYENMAAAGDRLAESRAELERSRVLCSMRPLPITDVSGLSQVAVGRWHACGLTADGTAICWGRNVEGALGRGTKDGSAYLGPAPVVPPR